MKTYRIKDWSRHYENNRTRDMKQMAWVPVPNKHDGEGFAAIMSHPEGIKLYGLWHLILQVASKCGEHGNSLRPRGTLLRDDGTPHTPRSIALKTRWNHPEDFEWALEQLCGPEIAWIECLEDNPAPSCGDPAPSCVEGKGREGNREREGEEPKTTHRKHEAEFAALSATLKFPGLTYEIVANLAMSYSNDSFPEIVRQMCIEAGGVAGTIGDPGAWLRRRAQAISTPPPRERGSATTPAWKRLQILKEQEAAFSAQNPHPERWTKKQIEDRKARRDEIKRLESEMTATP